MSDFSLYYYSVMYKYKIPTHGVTDQVQLALIHNYTQVCVV